MNLYWCSHWNTWRAGVCVCVGLLRSCFIIEVSWEGSGSEKYTKHPERPVSERNKGLCWDCADLWPTVTHIKGSLNHSESNDTIWCWECSLESCILVRLFFLLCAIILVELQAGFCVWGTETILFRTDVATVNRRGRPGFISLWAAKNTCLLENGRAGGGGWSVAELSHQCCLSELQRRSTAPAAESEDSQRTSTSIKQQQLIHFLLTAECILILITFPHLFLVYSRIMQIR